MIEEGEKAPDFTLDDQNGEPLSLADLRGERVARAKEVLISIGMYPLHLKKEIDAHIADRFLEAVWR